MKRHLALVLAVLLMLTACACKKEEAQPTQASTVATAPTEPVKKSREDMHIWISVPDEQDEYWSKAGMDLQELLENLLYQVHLIYANNDPVEQEEQLKEALSQGADCLIVAPVDAPTLEHVAKLAEEKGVCLVSYDRLWTDTDAVDYYASYDYAAMGTQIGEYIVETALYGTSEPVTIEFFMGMPEDHNTAVLWDGIYAVLGPYLQSGRLVSKSGRTALEDVCVVDKDLQTVERTMDLYLDEYYEGSAPDVICTTDDSFANACILALERWEITQMPLITGIGGGEGALEHLRTGKQAVSFTLEMQPLNDDCIRLLDSVLNNKEFVLSHPEGVFNNVKQVPANLYAANMVTREMLAEEEVE